MLQLRHTAYMVVSNRGHTVVEQFLTEWENAVKGIGLLKLGWVSAPEPRIEPLAIPISGPTRREPYVMVFGIPYINENPFAPWQFAEMVQEVWTKGEIAGRFEILD